MSDRLEAVRAILREAGVPGEVTEAGAEGEIAAVRSDPGVRERLAELAPRIRAAGFRYVALDPVEGINEIEAT